MRSIQLSKLPMMRSENYPMNMIGTAGAATTAMTLFSLAISKVSKEDFSEPALLNSVLYRMLRVQTTRNDFKGWSLHYLAGFLFVEAYDTIWKGRKRNATVMSGATLGLVSGLIGAGVWRTIGQADPGIRALHKKSYYLQLVAAHIVFGIAASLTYKGTSKSLF